MHTHTCAQWSIVCYITNFQFIVHWIVLDPEWISKGHEVFIYTKNDGVSKYPRQFFSPIYMIGRIVEKTACLLWEYGRNNCLQTGWPSSFEAQSSCLVEFIIVQNLQIYEYLQSNVLFECHYDGVCMWKKFGACLSSSIVKHKKCVDFWKSSRHSICL